MNIGSIVFIIQTYVQNEKNCNYSCCINKIIYGVSKMRIVFPTKENMSYLSQSALDINEAKYLTVLDIQNQTIVGVEMIKNSISSNNEEFVQTFKENQYEAIVVTQSNSLPLNELKNAGISVYTDSKSQSVLNAFNDYLNQRLALA